MWKYRHIRLFYFQKYRNFVGTRSCSNQTKLGMEYPKVMKNLGQKNFWYSLSRKKVSFSFGSLLLFEISNFKHRSFSSDQGVVQSEPNRYPRLPVPFRL